MTGNIFDIKSFAVHDGPGIRTTFFLKGCSLRCQWCHNPEGMSEKPQLGFFAHLCTNCRACQKVCPQNAHFWRHENHLWDIARCKGCGRCTEVCHFEALKWYGRAISVEEAVEISLRDRLFYRNSDGGVTVSGGEPLLQARFVRLFFQTLKTQGIATAVDTCGNVEWKAFEEVLPWTDIFLYDCKAVSTALHQEGTGCGNEKIIFNLKKLDSCNKVIEIRVPLIPGFNDSEKELRGIADLLASLQTIRMVKILPYHSFGRTKAQAVGVPMTDFSECTEENLQQAINIFLEYGLTVQKG